MFRGPPADFLVSQDATPSSVCMGISSSDSLYVVLRLLPAFSLRYPLRLLGHHLVSLSSWGRAEGEGTADVLPFPVLDLPDCVCGATVPQQAVGQGGRSLPAVLRTW